MVTAVLLMMSIKSFAQVNYWFRYTKEVMSIADLEVQARALENDRAQYSLRGWSFIPLNPKGLELIASPSYFYHKRPVNSRQELRLSAGFRETFGIVATIQGRSRVLADYRHFIDEPAEWRFRLQQAIIIPLTERYKIRPQAEWLLSKYTADEVRLELSGFSKVLKNHEIALGYQAQIIHSLAHHCLLLQFR